MISSLLKKKTCNLIYLPETMIKSIWCNLASLTMNPTFQKAGKLGKWLYKWAVIRISAFDELGSCSKEGCYLCPDA